MMVSFSSLVQILLDFVTVWKLKLSFCKAICNMVAQALSSGACNSGHGNNYLRECLQTRAFSKSFQVQVVENHKWRVLADRSYKLIKTKVEVFGGKVTFKIIS